jgi:hypothetical protein
MKMHLYTWPTRGIMLALAGSMVAATGWLAPIQAQTFTPPGQGSPKGTAGGSRPAHSDCSSRISTKGRFLALSAQRFISLTSEAQPSFWVYVPHTTARSLEFSLLDDQQNGIYQTSVQLEPRAGLVKLTLPADQVSLTEGKIYSWTAALICNPKCRTDDWLVQGWVRRQALPPDFDRRLQTATAQQRLQLYAEAGFWYDTLNTLVELWQSQPANPKLTALWSELLQMGGLPAITEPLKVVQADTD